MNKPLTFLLALTFLFLFCGSVFGGDMQDGIEAYERKKNYKEAHKLLLPLAEQGNATAQHYLGLMYYNGEGVQQDYKESVRLYRLSAEQGHAGAQHYLGAMYEEGQGVQQDYEETECWLPMRRSHKWYRLSAKQGGAKALKWYRLSAEQGDVLAQSNLGEMYEEGRGVPKDFKEAVKWSKLAADQGYAYTQNSLSYMYYKGQGVPKDYVLAHMWWNIASSNGHKGDMKFRDIIEKKMSPSQLEKAQEMAINWEPKKK
ncbi:MAG TPA: sel1 repeat family protein [Nitrospinaceae bacterium]|nr:sel1 repeat family protein [Nitrospinaceae bacterium]